MLNKEVFNSAVKDIEQLFDRLLACPLAPPQDYLESKLLKGISGVYIFSEGSGMNELFWYVGQSSDILSRLKEHCAVQTNEKANFAYKLTLETTGQRLIPGSPNSTKQSMFNNSDFSQEFQRSITRIKKMNLRWIELSPKLEKNFLEIYASVVVTSKFNNFN